MEQKNKDLAEVNELFKDIESTIKRDAKDRKQILRDVENDLESHSKKMVEYDRTAKAYKLLEVKYNALEKEFTDSSKIANDRITKLKEENDNLENENKILKRVVMNQKRKISGLQSIVELVVNDYGIQNIELVTGLSSDKIKEYFQD